VLFPFICEEEEGNDQGRGNLLSLSSRNRRQRSDITILAAIHVNNLDARIEGPSYLCDLLDFSRCCAGESKPDRPRRKGSEGWMLQTRPHILQHVDWVEYEGGKR
jgi:hypothetical protein